MPVIAQSEKYKEGNTHLVPCKSTLRAIPHMTTTNLNVFYCDDM